MNKQIKYLGIFLVMCFLAVFLKLHQTQVFEVESLARREDNLRPATRRYNKPRGKIVTADGVVLAESIQVSGNIMTPRKRQYPEGELFGHITGFYSRLFDKTGVELVYDAHLAGDTLKQQFDGLGSLFSGKDNVGHITLTLRKDLQELAREQLGDREGAVTVLDPRTGAILAMWSFPSYDPTEIVRLDDIKVAEAENWFRLIAGGQGNPMLSKAYRNRYPPGSTYKPVTAATGLMTGKASRSQPVFPQRDVLTFSDDRLDQFPLRNFEGGTCGGALPEVMRVSCNTAFAQMGLDVGLPALVEESKNFGWLQDVPIDLPNPAQSTMDTVERDTGQAGLARVAIGQRNVAATPLQMAMVAAGIANGGTLMTPHVMYDVRNQDALVVDRYAPKAWLEPLSADQAVALREIMYEPVRAGTLANAIRVPPGIQAGGKTGTAQTGVDASDPLHVWTIAFAGPAGQTPTVAVSVVVLNQPNRGEATGGQIAGPIANAVLNKALEVVDQQPDVTGLLAPTPVGPPSAPSTTREP